MKKKSFLKFRFFIWHLKKTLAHLQINWFIEFYEGNSKWEKEMENPSFIELFRNLFNILNSQKGIKYAEGKGTHSWF
jgi:hypothetical protein